MEEAHETNRRTSSGHRKIDVGDMILMWLIRKHQAWSYVVLGVMFDVSWKSASNYCEEIQSVFVGTLGSALLLALCGGYRSVHS